MAVKSVDELFIDRSTIKHLNTDASFHADETFRGRDRRFYLPQGTRSVGIEVNVRAFYSHFGHDDPAPAVTVIINGHKRYDASSCLGRTHFAGADGKSYSIPLSAVDIGKLLAEERPGSMPPDSIMRGAPKVSYDRRLHQ
jgi:hypothetical protein